MFAFWRRRNEQKPRPGRLTAARKRTDRLLVAGHAFRRDAAEGKKSGEHVLATADGKEAATALLKAAVQWRNEARQYTHRPRGATHGPAP